VGGRISAPSYSNFKDSLCKRSVNDLGKNMAAQVLQDNCRNLNIAICRSRTNSRDRYTLFSYSWCV